MDNQTGASVTEAQARVVSADAQLAPARAQLERDQDDLKRMEQLFAKAEVSKQDRDHAESAVKISKATVTALEQAVKAESAAQDGAQANRKQVDARQSAINTTMTQFEKARATAAEVTAQPSYTKT